VSALAIAVLSRAPFFTWPLTVDEGSYAYTAHWWARGLTLYSNALWFDRPQAIFLAYALGNRLLGESTIAIRLWGAVWAAATAYGSYLIALRLWGRREAFVALVLSATFSAAPHIEGFTSNAETFMILPAVFSAYCLLVDRRVAAGLLAGCSAVLKPSGVVALVFGCLWLARAKRDRRAIPWFVAAASLPLIVSVTHAWVTVGLSRYAEAVLLYRLRVNTSRAFMSEGTPLLGLALTFPVWAPLLLGTVEGLRSSRRDTRLFGHLWIVTASLGVAMGGHWLMHYFLQLVVPLATLASRGVVAAWDKVSAGTPAAIAPLMMASALLFAFIEGTFLFEPAAVGTSRLYARPPYLVSGQVAQYLRGHSAKGDTLYVAFYEAEIYHLAEMQGTSRFLFRLDLDELDGAFDSVVRDIEAEKPTFVVDFNQPLAPVRDRERFYRALHLHYDVAQSFESAVIYRRASRSAH